MNTDRDVATATLVTRLNRQLYASTPSEKYATFYCAVFDESNSRLSYANGGHLAPILLRQPVMDPITQWAHDPSARDDITMLLASKL